MLFVIDPRPYQAELKRAQALLEQAKSQLTLAKSEQDRAHKLLTAHAISREELESREAALAQGNSSVSSAKASVDVAKLNMTFTRVTSPITGVVSRANITPGNLVTSGETWLTTVVSVDPIYVSFQGDESGFLGFLNFTRKDDTSKIHPVFVGLANEEGYLHKGNIAFVDNEIDAATGTVRVRGSLANPNREFTPGMFARVKVVGEKSFSAILINDTAVGTDQDLKYVLRLGKNNTVEYRVVNLGAEVDGLRVVREGLAPGDTIIVNGLQHVRPGMVISPQRIKMGEDNLKASAAAPAVPHD